MRPLRHYLELYRGSGRNLVLATGGAVVQSLLLIPVAILIRRAFNDAVPGGQVDALVGSGVAIAGLYLASGGVALWSRALALRTTKRAITRLRESLVEQLLALPRDVLVRGDAALTQGILVHDTERVDVMTNEIVNQFVPAVVLAIAIGAFLAYLNPLLFLAVLTAVPILAVILRRLNRQVRRLVAQFHAAFDAYSQGVLFLVQRADLTRSQAAEDFELGRQAGTIATLEDVSGTMAWWHTAHGVAQETVTSASWALILVLGGIAVSNGGMSIGDVLSFLVAATFLKRAVNTMVAGIPLIVEGSESLRTLEAFASQPTDTSYLGDRRIAFDGWVRLEDVSFAYGSQPLLRSVDLAAEPGRLTVVTGASGSGKTTLLYLILGFYRPQSGRLLADGRAYDDVDIHALRREIGYVAQDPIVFAGTILDNLTYGSVEVDELRAREAARLALAEAFIDDLPDRYATRVGEGGALLSGGQRQRLSIARALYRRPRLILLDEPTNQLDQPTARAIFDNLRALPDGPSIIAVTHDTDLAAEYADELLTLDRGQLVRSGPVARIA